MVIRDDPQIDLTVIADCLAMQYGITVRAIRFLPIGYDTSAFVYRIDADNGAAYFLKIRSGPIFAPSLSIPLALAQRSVAQIVAPIQSQSGALFCALSGHAHHHVTAYPFISGENAMVAGLDRQQWQIFGKSLRAVHESGLHETFLGELRVENFALPAAAHVRDVLDAAQNDSNTSPVASRFASFLKEKSRLIEQLVTRAEELGRSLASKSLPATLCHADIHAANILIGDDGAIWLVDWDGPMIAPRERDLLFVVGSRIARIVEPYEEDWFFEGYGPTKIDRDALIYYRYERIIEDLGQIGKQVLLNPDVSDDARESEALLAMGFFDPGADIERAESVPRLIFGS